MLFYLVVFYVLGDVVKLYFGKNINFTLYSNILCVRHDYI